MNNIIFPELESGIKVLLVASHDTFDDLIRGFFENYSSELTRREYLYAIRGFFAFLSSNGRDVREPRDIKKLDLIQYRNFLAEKTLSANTIGKKLAGLSAFFKYLGHEGLVDRDLTYGLRRPKFENAKETAALMPAEVERIFAALDRKKACFEVHQAALALGFYCGLRVNEIRNLTFGSIGTERGVKVLYLRVKGDKKHEIALHPKALSSLEDLRVAYDEKGVKTQCDSHIFPSSRNKLQPMSKQAFCYIFQVALDRAKIERNSKKRYNTHSMRASFASHLLNDLKVPLQDVQRLMGHQHPSTTQHYNKRQIEHSGSPVFQIKYQ